MKRLEALRHTPAWLWLAGIAAGLRFVNLGSEALWYDESFSGWLSKLDLSHLWLAVRGDVHPPTWYLVEWVSVRLLGNSAFTLRLPAAVLGVISVLLVWRLALALKLDRRTAFVAGLLAATLPVSLYYGQDARMYPMLACFVLWALISAIEQRWRYFALACIGTAWTHNLGVFYVAALGLTVLLARCSGAAPPTRRTLFAALAGPMAALLATVIAWLPWGIVMLEQVRSVAAGFWIEPFDLGNSLLPLGSMTFGWRVPDALQLHFYTVAVAFTLMGLIASRRWLRSGQGLLLLSVVFGVAVMVGLVSATWRSIYLGRAFFPAVLALMVLWAYSLVYLSPPNRRAAQAVLIPVMVISCYFHYFPVVGARFDVPSWADAIRAKWQPGDAIYHVAIDSYVLLSYYTEDKPVYLLPEATDLAQSLSEDTKRAMGFRQAWFADLASHGYKRAWLVVSQNPLTSQMEIDAVNDILSGHQHELVLRHAPIDFASQSVYLVDLWRP